MDEDLARLTISGTGPYWHKFSVTVDGKVLPVRRLSLEIDPQTGKCEATVVLDEWALDVTDVPTRVVAGKRSPSKLTAYIGRMLGLGLRQT